MSATIEFIAAMAAAGLDFSGEIIPDGQLHRIKLNGDRKPDSWYTLHLDGIAAGSFGCWKRGISETWCARTDDTLTEAERAERDRKWGEQQAARIADQRRQNDAARIKAQEILDAASPADDEHPYLQRKGVHVYPGVKVGAWPQRRMEGCLLIPARAIDGRLATVEAIFPEKPTDGRDKDFLKGGAKVGAFFAIGDLASATTILIAEGYATAATLHEATGYPTVVAFDAGNLAPVITAIRTTYLKTPLIICSDNDRATPGNPGLSKASRIVDGYKTSLVKLVVPKFTEDERGSDFNDLAALHGLTAVKDAVEAAIRGKRLPTVETAQPTARPMAAPANSWRACLLRNSEDVVSRVLPNAVLIAENAYPGLVGYNEFSRRIEARTDAPWRKQPGSWADHDTRELVCHVVSDHNLPSFSSDLMNEGVQTAARRHPFNPAQDRLRALAGQWDGMTRLDGWLTRYLNAEATAENQEYLAEIGAAWLKGVCARVLMPGCKRDDVLTLVGPQGFLKSSAAQAIAEGILPDSFTDSLGNLGSDEAAIGVQGIIIAEFSELAAMGRSELEAVKAFITRRSDRYREKYERMPTDHPRTCSFIATTNDDAGFLRDPSGNRRWWPVKVARKIDLDTLRTVIPMLLGEAASRVLAGEPWHVTNEVANQQAEQARDAHKDSDVWEAAVLDAAASLDDKKRTISEILLRINVELPRQDRAAQNRVSNILRGNGYQRKRRRDGRGTLVYLWSVPITPVVPITPGGEQEGNSQSASQKAGCSSVPIGSHPINSRYMGSESENATSAHPTGESNAPKEIQPEKNFIGERGERGEQGEQMPSLSRQMPPGASGDARQLWEILKHYRGAETAARLARKLGWNEGRAIMAAQELSDFGRARISGDCISPIHPPVRSSGNGESF